MKDSSFGLQYWIDQLKMATSEKSTSGIRKQKDGMHDTAGMTIFAVAFVVMMAFIFMVRHAPPSDILPLVGIIAVTILLISPLWLWIRNKHEINRQKLLGPAANANPEDSARTQRLEERMENLEALICRLDAELNHQIERSLMTRPKIAVATENEVSQMPTSFLTVATALEGRYQILKELGRGGMGVVFHAHDKQLNEQVAIKILSPLLGQDPEALARLKREVSAARRVTHANVIRIHDISEINGLYFVSMEYFGGTSLKDHIRQNGALSMLQGFQIISQVCDGLEAAHQQGVIHRDLKSQNIILNSTKSAKIIDFGLARTSHLEGMTATGLIMGTPEYMAPEQVSGKRVDERADIYSLGIILYEVFTGRLPFTGESAIAVGFRQIKDDPQPPRELNPQIPEEVERIILKALDKNPIHRYRTVSELKDDLENAIVKRTAPATLERDSKVQRQRQTE